MKSRKSYAPMLLILLFTGVFSLYGFPPVEIVSAGAAQFRIAPLNPAFIEWQEEQKEDEQGLQMQTSSRRLSRGGVRPDPVDWSHLAKAQYALTAATPLPDRYDLRDHNTLTEIRNQYPYGTCWAFATFASLESTQKRSGQVFDFAERHLAWFVYNDYGGMVSFTQKDLAEGQHPVYDQGGNFSQSAAVLTRGIGPVREEDSPYYKGMGPAEEDIPRILNVTDVYRLYIAPVVDSDDPLEDRRDTYEEIKRWIMNYGAVGIMFDAAGDLNKDAFYDPDRTVQHLHLVAIVGWDDDYPVEKFSETPPPNPGAWIVRNSWGGEWGEGGYFYLSYYDASIIPEEVALFKGSPVHDFKIYLHDPLGQATNILAPTGINAMWGANIFTASEDGLIEAVAFDTSDAATAYNIRIYRNPSKDNPSSGTLQTQQTGFHIYAGYHTVSLDSPVRVRNGDTFSVVINVSREPPEIQIRFPAEADVPNYSTKATGNPGESFLSIDADVNSMTKWTDLIPFYFTEEGNRSVTPTNLCIRALYSPVTESSGGGGCDTTGFAALAILLLICFYRGRKQRR